MVVLDEVRLIFLQNGKTKNGDVMKEFFKAISLIAVGLIAAIVVYPFLHESGHTLAALVVGAEVSDIQLLPIPSMLCQLDSSNKMQVIVIGFGGIMLPFMLTVLKPPKRFIPWYLWFLIKGICILSFVISLWAIMFYQTEFGIATDDMTRVLQFAPEYKVGYGAAVIILLVITIAQAVHSRPTKRCMEYFDV